MPDYFISYNRGDKAWAEWIAWTLEASGATTVLQAWDFRPGGNFVLQMQRAAEGSARTIAVLSPDFLTSTFTGPEWAAAFADDPTGLERKLVPVRVRACEPGGLLKAMIYIDLVGLDERAAEKALTEGLTAGRGKPSAKPTFPGAIAPAKPFPGPATPVSQVKLRRAPTELERRRFLRDAFALIAESFESGLEGLKQNNPGLETDLRRQTSEEFRAEVFVDGKLRANCRIWLGGMFGDNGISFAEGSAANTPGSSNEVLSVRAGDDLALEALMNFGLGRTPEGVDPKHMSAQDAAAYLFARFLWRLT